MLRIAICDDEPSVCAELKAITARFRQKTTEGLTAEIFYSGEELVSCIKEGQGFDLIFLDIALGDMTGVDIGHVIRSDLEDHITQIAYITSKSGYERQLFEVQPLCFLPKPLIEEKVHENIELAIKILSKGNNFYEFKDGQYIRRIQHKEIIYFANEKRRVKLVSTKGEFYHYIKIDAVARTLSSTAFVRPHKSFLVNHYHIVRYGVNEIVMSNGDAISISQKRRKEIRDFLAKYLGEE